MAPRRPLRDKTWRGTEEQISTDSGIKSGWQANVRPASVSFLATAFWFAFLCAPEVEAKHILLLRTTFSDNSTEPVSHKQAQAMMDEEVEPFFREMSFGQEEIEIVVSADSYALEHPTSHYQSNYQATLEEAKSAASSDFELSEFTDIGVVFPRLSLSWGGRARGSSFYINGARNFSFALVAHEIGHTYGVRHANYWKTEDSPLGDGESVEYGDIYDVMGKGKDSRAHFGPRFKSRIGWLSDQNAPLITESGRYRLHCFDNPKADLENTLAIKIRGRNNRYFWLGLRGQFLGGFGYPRGVYGTWDDDVSRDSNLIDMGTIRGRPLYALLPEQQSFTDDEEGVTITAGAIRGSGVKAYVDIDVTLSPPDRPLEIWGTRSRLYDLTTLPENPETIVDIALTGKQALALRSDGTVFQWGRIFNDEAPPPDLRDVVRIAATGIFCIALRADGTAEHWGHRYGATIEQETNIVDIAAGEYHCLALHADGTVTAHGSREREITKVPLGLSDVTAIAAGEYHSLVLKSDGTLVTWGTDRWDVTTIPSGLNDVVAIDCTHSGSIALKSDGTVVQWGYVTEEKPDPLPQKVRRIAAADFAVLVQFEDGSLSSWGTETLAPVHIPRVRPDEVRVLRAGGANAAIVVGPEREEPFHFWRVRHRISVDDSLESDRDGDQISLLGEYALGLNPRRADGEPSALGGFLDGDHPTFAYRVSQSAVDVATRLEVTTASLSQWEPVDPTETGITEGITHLQYRVPEDQIAAPVFGRLRFSRIVRE